MSQLVQPSFASGEISPAISGRIDLAKYQTGLSKCRNFIVQAYGGVTNRPGTIYVGNARNNSVKEYLMPFRWGDGQNYVLVLGDKCMRIIYRGGFVTNSSGNEIVVTTPWAAADIFDLHIAQSADVVTVCHNKYKPHQIKRYAHNDWEVEEYVPTNGPFDDINIDETKTISSQNAIGATTLTANFDAFSANDVGREVYLEVKDWSNYTAWMAGVEAATGNIVVSNSKVYQCVATNGGGAYTGSHAPDHEEGDAWDGYSHDKTYNYGAKWRYLCDSIGIAKITSYVNSRKVNAVISRRIANNNPSTGGFSSMSDIQAASSTTEYITLTIKRHGLWNGATVKFTGSNWSGATHLNVNGNFSVQVVDADKFRVMGAYAYYMEDDTYEDEDGTSHPITYPVSATWTGGGTIAPASTSGSNSATTFKWALSAWCPQNGYPSAVGYFQQRMIFAGSTERPQTAWMTQTGSYSDFATSIPALDDDAITFTLAASQVSPIRHILSLRSLLLMAGSSEWSVANSDDVVTPTTINLKTQSYRGSSNLSPLCVGNMALVCQAKGRVVRDLGYEWASDSYSGNDLCVMAEHLFSGHELTDWDYAQDPYSVAWCIRDDGILLGLTYMREHEVFAWHRHDTDGKFESVCVIEEDNTDCVYVTVSRTVNGQTKRFIEKFATREAIDVKSGIFLDCSLSYSGTPRSSFGGLSHLNGMTVGVVADGSVRPDCVVTNGSIDIGKAASVVHVGLHYVSELETLRLVGQDGSIFGHKAIVRSIKVLCRDSRGMLAGTDFDRLFEVKQRTNEPYGDPMMLKTGFFEIGVSSSWSNDCHICIRQKDPLPCTILSIAPDIQVGG